MESSVMKERIYCTFFVIIFSIVLFAGMGHTAPHVIGVAVTDEPITLVRTRAYPSDPSTDLSWTCGSSNVTDIECAFNAGRGNENPSLPSMDLPSQSTWNAMTDGEKALWLINSEREDRGVVPLHGVESNVTSVAQNYADYLLVNDLWGHYEDGHGPYWRLNQNPAIGSCHDSFMSENLAVFVTSGSSIPLPIERSIYMWMYDDGDCCSWGHRHAILWYPYNDNSGPSGMEGFLGIGRANGGPYQGPFASSWNFAELIVMNVFDPCSTWYYTPSTYDIDIIKAGSGTGTVTSSPAGIDCGTDCSETYDSDTVVTLTPTPDSGSRFDGWSGDCTGTGTCQTTMDSDKTVTATFIKQYNLTVSNSGSGSGTVSYSSLGTDCGAGCQTYDTGTSVTLTADPTSPPFPAAGSRFIEWSGDCTGTGACLITMDQSKSVSADFIAQFDLFVSKTGSGDGTVTSSPGGIDCGSDCTHTYDDGTSVTLTAAPSGSCSHFVGWSGGECSGTDPCTISILSNENIFAEFGTDAPVANFVDPTASGGAPVISRFTDLSTCPTSWAWAFGDGTTSTEQNPTHIYTAPGTYSVFLFVSNDSGSLDHAFRLNSISVTDCGNASVQVGVGTTAASIEAAYTAAASTDEIRVHALEFNENSSFAFDQDKTIDLKGGRNCEGTDAAMGTIYHGTMTLSDGTINIENIIISP